jgi:hypothetical protein
MPFSQILVSDTVWILVDTSCQRDSKVTATGFNDTRYSEPLDDGSDEEFRIPSKWQVAAIHLLLRDSGIEIR